MSEQLTTSGTMPTNPQGNADDPEYDAFLHRIRGRLRTLPDIRTIIADRLREQGMSVDH